MASDLSPLASTSHSSQPSPTTFEEEGGEGGGGEEEEEKRQKAKNFKNENLKKNPR